MEEVKRVLEEESEATPGMPVNRSRNNQWGIKRQSYLRMMKELGYHPYTVRRQQVVSPLNVQKRLKFCQTVSEMPEDFFKNLIITDEKIFVAKGHVFSKKNCVKWAKRGEGSPSHWYSEGKVYPTKVHVWAAVTGNGDLFGPYFIEGTLTSAGYINLLRDEVFPEMVQKLGKEQFSKMWFQQDGASPHRTRASIDFLHSIFGHRLIALNADRVGGFEWPPTSPDLSTLDFHTWTAICRKLYFGENPPRDLASLKSGLVAAFAEVDREEIRRAVNQGFRSRVKQCLENGGGHFERKIAKKEKLPTTQTSVDLFPYTYAHICDDVSSKLIVGPTSYQLLPGEKIAVPPSPFVHIPPRHCARVKFEDQTQTRTGESFPLFPGETLISIQKIRELEDTGFEYIPSPIPSESTEAQGICHNIKIKFVADGENEILDLDEKNKEDLHHDLNILQEISRLAASLKDKAVGMRVSDLINQEIGEKQLPELIPKSPQLIPKSPICLQSPRSSRRASQDANENIFRSPMFSRSRSPRTRTPSPSPCSPRKSKVVDNSVILVEFPRKNYIYLDDLQSLEVTRWLTCFIIDYYVAHLHSFVLPPAEREAVFIFGSAFYNFLARAKGEHGKVARWTEDINIFQKKMLVIPVCEHSHWFLVLVVMPGLVTSPDVTNKNREPLLITLDSLGKDQTNTVKVIRQYLSMEWRARWSQGQGGHFQFSEVDLKHIQPRTPLQKNGYDCGIFLLHYLEKIFAR